MRVSVGYAGRFPPFRDSRSELGTINIQGVGDFEITFDSHRETFRNELNPAQGRKSTNPRKQRFAKASIESISVELFIVAGVTKGVATPADVVKVCEKAMSRSVIASIRSGTKVLRTTIKIGNWYKRTCVIESCDVEFMAPWASDGKPHRARINLTFKVDGLVHQPTQGNYKFNA